MSGPVIVDPPSGANERGRKRLSDVSAIFDGALPAHASIVFDNQSFELPSAIIAVLRASTKVLMTGSSVVIASQQDTLTSQQAADLLNISRPHLVKMAREGAVDYVMAGTHHRFPVAAVQAYAASMLRERGDALREIAPPAGYRDDDF